MASEQDDAVFDQDIDADDDDDSSRTHDDNDDDDDDEEEEEDDDETRTGIVLADDEDEDEVEDDDDLLLDNNVHSTTTFAAAAVVPTGVPSASAVTIASVPTAILSINPTSSPDNAKRHRTDAQFVTTPIMTIPPPMSSTEKKPLAVFDESRRLFQRLWTDEDEIELLRGFHEYTAQRGGATSHQDTTLFYDQIKSKLQLEFNKNQLVEKLRRLKKKYRNVMSKISSGKHVLFKSPHDQATFEISSKIWSNLYSTVANSNNINASVDVNLDEDDGDGNGGTNSFNLNDGDVRFDDHLHKNTPKSRKRSHPHAPVRIDDAVGNDIQNASNVHNIDINNSNNNVRNGGNVSGMIEEVVRSCVGPVFKELLSQALPTGAGAGVGHGGRGMTSGLFMNAVPLGFGGGLTMMGNEKWRKQQILELEVYSKRLELVQEQIRAQLEELRSVGG